MTTSTIAALEERFVSPDGSQHQTIGITREELASVIAEAGGGETIDEQWWLAELDQHGNPNLVDGAHSDRGGADQAKHLFDRLGFSGDRRLVVARVTLSETKPNGEGVNEEALAALNSIGLRPKP